MHLMSCEHPVRVYNKYIDKYLFVPCGKCNSCLNRKAMYWTNQCEKERRNSIFTMFVTLTYDEISLPVYNVTGGFDFLDKIDDGLQKKQIRYLQSTRLHDVECMALDPEKLFDEDADKELFFEFLKGKGIPYASKSDIQLFHKRLNKWFYDNVTNKFKNFRYFIVSELGSTTLRPHFHALYFINDSEVARRFSEALLACWKYGIVDCQYVENSACSYVAQYINKLHDLPSFYKAKQIRPFFLCSRSPIIGNVCESTQSDEEIFNSGTIQTFSYQRKDSRLVLSELDKSVENRLYPKCPCFSQISYSLRVELYSVVCRFESRTFQGFKERVKVFLDELEYQFKVTDFVFLLREYVDGFSVEGEEWLRRLYYLSRKVYKNALRFGISIFSYVKKIDDYYKNKELHLINKMYEFQQQYMENENNSPCVDDLVLMYPDYLHDNGFTIGDWLTQYTPREVICMRSDAACLAYSNKRTHFKNQYLDSLADKGNRFYKSLKNFYYAKNVMKLVKPSPHGARNDFDLSHRHIMSANFGELIPATTIETVPGDHIEMHASDLLRAIPMVTSPFLRAKQHLDVWFVPYKDLWHQFDNFITKKAQPVSSAMKDFAFCPWMYQYDLWDDGINSSLDIVGITQGLGAKRLLNYLGYSSTMVGSASNQNVKVNPFRLAAYNYIWYNEYRQQYYDDGTHLLPSGTNVACLFNFDNLTCDTEANAEVSPTLYEAMTQMRYRCWKKDLFTGLLPSTQFGNVSTIDVPAAQPSLIGNLEIGGTVSVISGNRLASNGDSNWYLASSTGSALSNFDVLSLRRSEAIQIWRENALRAGNRVKDNMRAHYGVESDFRDHRPTYLGSVDSPLNIGDVMATANSTYTGNTNPNVNVGDVAGKGLSSLDEKVFKFDAKDFGVIMVIFSLLPEAEYNAGGISRPNQLLDAEDFFTPEYENLGLEAVSSQTFRNVVLNDARVIGYAPRYWAYKTKLDKCYDLFMTGGINSSWCSPKYDVTLNLGQPGYTIPLATLYVNPTIFDVNFNVGISVSPQFLCDFYFDVDAVRPMSVVGLPFS